LYNPLTKKNQMEKLEESVKKAKEFGIEFTVESTVPIRNNASSKITILSEVVENLKAGESVCVEHSEENRKLLNAVKTKIYRIYKKSQFISPLLKIIGNKEKKKMYLYVQREAKVNRGDIGNPIIY